MTRPPVRFAAGQENRAELVRPPSWILAWAVARDSVTVRVDQAAASSGAGGVSAYTGRWSGKRESRLCSRAYW